MASWWRLLGVLPTLETDEQRTQRVMAELLRHQDIWRAVEWQDTQPVSVVIDPPKDLQAQIDMLKAEIERLKKHIVERG